MNTELLEQEGQEQRALPQTLCGALQREANWKCLILTLLIAGCLGAVTWCRLTEITKVIINFSVYPIKSTKVMSPCDEGYLYIPVAFMAMLYLVYLVECWHCTTRIELTHALQDTSGVLQRVRDMRESSPIVWWKAVCYHYVRRKRQVTRYRHGDSYTTTQVYYERVNSHAAGTRFQFTYCGVRDISRHLVLEARGPITKIRFSKGFAFSNAEAAAEFEEQRARFFTEHERYDDYMEMREGLDLAGVTSFKEFVIAFPEPDKRPWYTGSVAFWIASCLLLSWPLRMILEYNTAHVHYQVTKLFGVNYDAPRTPLPDVHRPLSQGDTFDSELEWRIRDNLALVPSYSEALLLEVGEDTEGLLTSEPPQSEGDPEVPQPNSSDNTRRFFGSRSSLRPAAAISRSSTYQRLDGEDLSRRLKQNVPRSKTQVRLCGRPDAEGGALGRGRRSWAGIFGSRNSLSRCAIQHHLTENNNTSQVLFYSRPLLEHSPQDPFQGRAVTTPTEDPPKYEDALRLPVLSRLRRSLTERGEAGRGRNISMETSL